MEQKELSQTIPYPRIASEIEEMVAADQGMREKSLTDDEFWDESIDRKNTGRMREIVTEIGLEFSIATTAYRFS